MIVFPKWLKERINAHREMRMAQRRITSEEARIQYRRVNGLTLGAEVTLRDGRVIRMGEFPKETEGSP